MFVKLTSVNKAFQRSRGTVLCTVLISKKTLRRTVTRAVERPFSLPSPPPPRPDQTGLPAQFTGLFGRPLTFLSLPGLTKLVSQLSREGNWQKGLEMFENLDVLGVRPDTTITNAAISACDKGGQWERALQVGMCACPGVHPGGSCCRKSIRNGPRP